MNFVFQTLLGIIIKRNRFKPCNIYLSVMNSFYTVHRFYLLNQITFINYFHTLIYLEILVYTLRNKSTFDSRISLWEFCWISEPISKSYSPSVITAHSFVLKSAYIICQWCSFLYYSWEGYVFESCTVPPGPCWLNQTICSTNGIHKHVSPHS